VRFPFGRHGETEFRRGGAGNCGVRHKQRAEHKQIFANSEPKFPSREEIKIFIGKTFYLDELTLEVAFEGVIRRYDETELQSDSKMGQGGPESRREVFTPFSLVGSISAIYRAPAFWANPPAD
jgi:hypothetical protein